MRTASRSVLHREVDKLQAEFPWPATFKARTDPERVQCWCHSNMRQLVEKRMEEAVGTVQTVTTVVSFAGVSDDAVARVTNTAAVAKLRKEMGAEYDCTDGIELIVDPVGKTVTINTMRAFQDIVQRRVQIWLGMAVGPLQGLGGCVGIPAAKKPQDQQSRTQVMLSDVLNIWGAVVNKASHQQ